MASTSLRYFSNTIKGRCFQTAAFFLFALVITLGLSACGQTERSQRSVITGNTMGTYYRVTLTGTAPFSQQRVQERIEQRLGELNQTFSTYLPNSALSQFNRLSAGECLSVETSLVQVFELSEQIYQQSGRRFNPALGGLVDLWGFGATQREGVPGSEEVSKALELADFRRAFIKSVEEPASSELCKQEAVELDFSAVAKGYAVDVIVDELRSIGFSNVLVDIGGEIKGVGEKVPGKSWVIAIERPAASGDQNGNASDESFAQAGIQKALVLNGVGVATSGNYRNFFIDAGTRYAHTLDPLTGYPVVYGERDQILSASVVHEQTAAADAWATALMVAGAGTAAQLAIQHELSVYIVSSNRIDESTTQAANGLWEWSSPQFEQYLFDIP